MFVLQLVFRNQQNWLLKRINSFIRINLEISNNWSPQADAWGDFFLIKYFNLHTKKPYLGIYLCKYLFMKKRSTIRKKRTPIQLDFSPMSALGFMLIAFFQVNCLINTPQIMPLQMFEDDESIIGCGPPIKNTKVITLLCAPKKVYFYYGITDPKIDSVDYGNDLRKLILDRKKIIKEQFGVDEYTDKNGKELTRTFTTILIKATLNVPYGRVVDVLDEMNICEIKFFNLVDIQPRDEEMMKLNNG
jgi:hypothetical protein